MEYTVYEHRSLHWVCGHEFIWVKSIAMNSDIGVELGTT